MKIPSGSVDLSSSFRMFGKLFLGIFLGFALCIPSIVAAQEDGARI